VSAGGGDPKWVQFHELPAQLAELRGLDGCPNKLLGDVIAALATKPDETLEVDFGLRYRGRLFREVSWTDQLDIDWARWRAWVLPKHAEALNLSERDLRRTFRLVVTRAKIERVLAAVPSPVAAGKREAEQVRPAQPAAVPSVVVTSARQRRPRNRPPRRRRPPRHRNLYQRQPPNRFRAQACPQFGYGKTQINRS